MQDILNSYHLTSLMCLPFNLRDLAGGCLVVYVIITLPGHEPVVMLPE